MPTYEYFEKLPIWINSKDLAVDVYNIIRKEKLNKDHGLRDQIQRSAVSISSNIAEGFERGSKQSLIQFLYSAKGSLGELRSQLQIARDTEILSMVNFESLYKVCISLSKQLSGFIQYLKTSQIAGIKYKVKKDLSNFKS